MGPLKVTCVSIVPSPYQRDLFQALAARDEVRLRVIYCEGTTPDNPWQQVELRPFEQVLPGGYISWGGSRFLLNYRLPSARETDIFIFNGYNNLVSQYLLRRFAGRVPSVYWGERMVAASTGAKGKAQRWLARPLQKMDAVVAIGKGAAADYARRYPDKPVYEIPYLCDIDSFLREVPTRPRDPITILFCGQIIARKGVDLLLAAFETLVREGLPVRLLLIGREGELPAMLQKVSEAARARVRTTGFQEPGALPGLFRQGDIFVLPSRYDGWGVVVNQALGAGMPAICSSAVGAASTLVEDGVNGYVYEPEDVPRLTTILRDLVTNPARLRAMGAASLEKAQTIRPSAGAAKWVDILQRHARRTP